MELPQDLNSRGMLILVPPVDPGGSSARVSAVGGVSFESLFESANVSLVRIDGLLETVCGELARVPTIVECLSRGDGILPPGHGFDAESSKEVLSIEAKFLEELRQSTSHLRTSVGLFKEMQDARCKPFEDEASVVVRQIQRQDSVHSGHEGSHVEHTEEGCLCWLLIFLCNNVQC